MLRGRFSPLWRGACGACGGPGGGCWAARGRGAASDCTPRGGGAASGSAAGSMSGATSSSERGGSAGGGDADRRATSSRGCCAAGGAGCGCGRGRCGAAPPLPQYGLAGGPQLRGSIWGRKRGQVVNQHAAPSRNCLTMLASSPSDSYARESTVSCDSVCTMIRSDSCWIVSAFMRRRGTVEEAAGCLMAKVNVEKACWRAREREGRRRHRERERRGRLEVSRCAPS